MCNFNNFDKTEFKLANLGFDHRHLRYTLTERGAGGHEGARVTGAKGRVARMECEGRARRIVIWRFGT